jgi:hypothetical protein
MSRQDIPENTKEVISALAIALIILHIIFPQRVGIVVVALLIILIAPWILPYVKSLPTPFGPIELRTECIPKEYVEDKVKELYQVEFKSKGEELTEVVIDPQQQAKIDILNELLLEYEKNE